MEKTTTPVEIGYLFICEKCGTKLESDPEKNPSKLLQKKLKQEAANILGPKKVRPVVSWCLGICPDKKIAVAKVAITQEKAPEFFLIDPDVSNEILLF